ncbi:MAG: prolyl oligopeptidase family serine peptidase [Planctomycetes bacterium]|nr:prolyl oligopeptidase family serine peptidase [Planctomycetota bacterium]
MIRSLPVIRAAILLAAFLLACAPAARSGEEGAPPPLKFHAAPQGMLTHWLVAPPGAEAVAKLDGPPAEARLGDPAPGGEWTLHVSRSGEINLKPLLGGAPKGHVWCTLRVNSLTGGRRRLTVMGFSGIRAFLGGAKVLDKPAPEVPKADQGSARIELQKGETLLQVAVGIRWGHCRFLVQIAEEDGKKAAPGDDLLLRVAPGAKNVPDAGELLARSISFLPQKYFIEAGQPAKFGVGLESGWPLGVGRIKPVVRGPDGHAYALGRNLVPKAPDELNAAPWIFELPAPAVASAKLDLACDLVEAEGEKVLGSAQLRLYSLAGIETERAACAALLQKTAADAKKPLSAFPDTALALEKLANSLRDLAPPAADGPAALPTRMDPATGETLLGLLDEVSRCLPLEKEGRDPHEGRTGYFERALWSPIEESPQPYFMLAPSAWKKARDAKETKRFPLVVFLHGYVPDYHKHRWWTEMPAFNALFEKHDCFLAIPFGRSNADFLGAGEVDVLDAVAEMQKHYPIDADRIYLYGYSMGGMAVYTLGGHYPGRFAAGVVLAGRADSPLLMGTGGLATLHPFKQFLVRTDTPIELCENFVNTPLRIYHGADDTVVKPSEAERMAARLKEIGCDVQLNLPPGDHWSLFDVMQDEEPVAWLLKQKREANPKMGWLRNFSLTFGRRDGLEVNHLTGELQAFEVAWTNGDKLEINKVSKNVAEIFLGLREITNVVQEAGNDGMTLNAASGQGGIAPVFLSRLPDFKVVRSKDIQGNFIEWNWKSALRCGPIKEATYSGFVVVYGTSGGAEATARLKAQALKFADEWYAFAKSRPPVKADIEVTDVEKSAKNLFLFGEEQENTLHAACAATKKLPFAVKDGKVTIGEKTVALKDRGLMYIFPSPLEGANQSSSVVICAGLSYGEHLPGNHKLDLLPDFLLYTADPDLDGTRTNRPVCAGFFDGKWQLSKETTWWFGPDAVLVKEPSPVPPPKQQAAPEPEKKTEGLGGGEEQKTAPRKLGPKVAPSQP